MDAVGARQNRLAPAELAAAGAFDLQLVAERRQRRAGGFGHERLDLHVAAGEGALREPAGLERLLRRQAEVGDVGHELRVRLRLVPSAHDPEGDPRAVLLHEPRDDRVERPLARRQRVRVVRLEREQRAAVLQHEAGAVRDDAGAEPGVVALDQRHHVAVAIDRRQVDGVVPLRAGDALELRGLDRALRARRVDQLRALRRAVLAEQSLTGSFEKRGSPM